MEKSEKAKQLRALRKYGKQVHLQLDDKNLFNSFKLFCLEDFQSTDRIPQKLYENHIYLQIHKIEKVWKSSGTRESKAHV